MNSSILKTKVKFMYSKGENSVFYWYIRTVFLLI